MKLATKFLRVGIALCLLIWMANPVVKEDAVLPKPELPKISPDGLVSKSVEPKQSQHLAISTIAKTQKQVSELAPALKWLTPHLNSASNRARGQNWLSPFVPSISALKTFVQTGTDLGTMGPTPGDVLRYTVVINNAGGAMDATGVQFTDQIDANTTLVPNSLMSGPVAVNDTYSTVGNTSISVPAGSGLMNNDVNLNGTPMTVTGIDDTGTSGDVTFNANGSFTFNPDPGFEGPTTFTYTVNNGFMSATGTVTITVTGMIWYINAAAPGGGDGRLNTPFNSMSTFNGISLDGTGDNIFVYTGTYTNTNSTLLLGQQNLIGQGAVGASLAALAGVTFSVHPPISPATIPTINGTRPTINQAGNNINMQSNNEVRGVNISNTSGTALLGNGFTTALVREVSITNTGGVGVNFNNGILDVIIQSVTASNASNAISVTNTTGSFQVTGTGTTDGSGGTLTSISGRGIDLRSATNITLKNMTLTSANTTSDGGFAGACDEVNVLACFAAIYMDGVNTVTLDNIDIGSTAEHGIVGNSVSNLSITNCTATGNGNSEEENALKFRNLSGTCSITGSTFENSAYRVAHIINTTGNVNLTVTNCVFNNTISNTPGIGQDCFEMRTQGSATATVNLIGSSFQRARSKAIQIQAEGTSTMTVNITYCRVERFTGLMAGIDVASNGAGSTMNYNINNNAVIESSSEVAVLASTLNSTLNGRINRNLSIDHSDPSVGGSIFSIVRVLHDGSNAAKVEMKGNRSVTGTNLDLPVNFISINGTNAAHRFDAIVDSNIISNNAVGGVGIEGLYLRVGTSAAGGKINTLCGDVTRNQVTVPAAASGRAFRANRVDASSFLTLSGSSPVTTMWSGNGNSNTNGTINASTGVVFTGVAPPGCIAPSHASFAPTNEEIASIVNDGKLNDQTLLNEAGNKDISTKQKNTPPAKEPKVKEAEPAAPLMMMAGETVTVGAPSGFLLPAGKSITIQFDVTINTPLPLGVCQISNQGTVSGSNFSNVLTDDVAGAPINPTVTQLSKHSLGNLVFRDNNKNGVFDGGDAGVNGVVVNLYRDNGTTPGSLDGSDAFVISATTAGGGLYTFSNLCSDEYIVQIPSSEFGVGEPLNGLISSPTGAAADPDNNTDNDDNGQGAFGSSIASPAITLNYSVGSEVENNTTLDFGFKSPTLVSINDVTMNEGSGGGTTNFTFTVTRDDISEAFDLMVNTANVTTNGDFTLITGGMISFTAGGSNTVMVTVVVNADDVVEFNETFNVLISGAPAGVVITDGTGLGTITNDDVATVSINSVTNIEGNAGTKTYTFTVSADKAVAIPYTVNVGTVDGTATTADNDYVANSTTLNFAGTANESYTFDVTVNGDLKVEPHETFTVALSSVMAGGLQVTAGPNRTGTINNDDSATISIDDVTMNEGNAGTTNFTFTATLSAVVSSAVTVNFTTANGTAGAGDYNTTSGMITFPANGAGQMQTITVQVIGDAVGEANETFFVNLSNIVGSPDVTFADDQGLGTILDDDLSFSINDVTMNEGNAGTTNFTFTVTRTSTATAETIDFAVAAGTASDADNDYVLNAGGTLNFAIGDNSETITVVVNGDEKVELNETFFVNLSNVSNGSIGDAQGLGTITNDDAATLTVNSVSDTEGDAGTKNYTFTVTLDKAVDVPISVDIVNSNISATSGSGDFVANSTTLNFAGTAGETKDFVVVVNGDMIVEPDETFIVILSSLVANSRNVTLVSPGIGTITNDDAATISIDDVTLMEGNAGTTNFVFTVSLSKVVSTAVSVDFTTLGVTATSGVDFNANSNTITFPANGAGQTQTITVQVIGDVLGEANETFNVNLSNIVGSPSVTFADAQGVGTILDDDLAFSINDVSISEGNAGTTNLIFTVTRTSTATAETIQYATADNTAATSDNDYTSTSGTLNFAIGDDTETITVVLTGDTKVELNETFFVNLSNASNGAISDAQGVGTITNDDQATLTIDNVSQTEGNAGTQIYTFTVSVDKAVDVPFSVNVGTVDGTALAGTDYVTNSTTLNFSGIAAIDSKTFDVTVNGDMLVEPTELFTVPLSAVSASGRDVVISGPSGTGTGTITNDDNATISIDNVSLTEGNAGTVNFVFNVTLSKVVSTAVTVDFATVGVTAAPGIDFNSNSGSITFPANGAGQTQTITVQVIGDVLGEANETFDVGLSNIVGSASVSFADAQGVGTILDDDLAFSINDVTLSEGNAGATNFTFTVTRTSIATAETIDFTTANNTATTGDNDYVLNSGTLNFAIGDDSETITVVVNGDNKVEANETFFVNLSNASNGNISDAQGLGTINNDDAAVVHLQLLDATKLEGNAGTTSFTFTATLNNPVQGGFDLAYTTSDGTATLANLDYQDNDGTLTFAGTANEQKIITVLVNGDTDVELDETFTVSIEDNGFSNTTVPLSALSTASTVIATIQNDDSDVNAGNDVTICASTTMIQLDGTITGAGTGGTWTTSGTGTFIPDANTVDAKYMFSAADTAANFVRLILTSNGPSAEKDTIDITIDPEAKVNVGPDQTVCASDTIYLNATFSGLITDGGVWSLNPGAGAYVGPDNVPSVKFLLSPAGKLLSSFKLSYMTNDPTGFCQGGTDTIEIFVNPEATVEAGANRIICASQDTIRLNGSIGGAATMATWTSTGTGTFSPNATTLNAIYTPSLADTAAGLVKLYLTTNEPNGECEAAVDSILLQIDPEATVNVGPDQTVCASDTIYLNATFSGLITDGGVWSLNPGAGAYVGPDNVPSVKFLLSPAGKLLSSFKLSYMTNDPPGFCQGGTDTIEIFVNPEATVEAGANRIICASQDTIRLNGSIGGAATMATWTSTGTGTFSPNATTLNAIYTPSLADTAAGLVKLYLTTNEPNGECEAAVDSILLQIDPEATVNVGPDQTVCSTDTIYLNATFSGLITDGGVWSLNPGAGAYVGPDNVPSVKFLLSPAGKLLSSFKLSYMTNDPPGFCQGGTDTIEIFISDPIDASVSIDQDTICVDGEVIGTFTESTLPPGSEFTLTIEYTDENGANSITLTDVVSGDQQTFTEGVDFDGITTVTRIIVTPEDPGFCSDTLDGFEIYVQVCEATISDPCVCQNNAQVAPNGTNSNTGTFRDVVQIEGPINQSWTVASVTGLYEDAAGTDPVDVGDAFTQVSPGVYQLVGYHIDAVGYTISVTNGRGVTLEANNKCFYPNPVFTGLPALVAPSAAPFQVTGTVADNVAGTGTFLLDGVAQAGASPAPTVVTINPATLSVGTHTLEYSFDAGAAASKDSLDPGCVQVVRQRFQVAHCGCQDVTVSLDANCQFVLTGNLVSDANCGGGTVRVMDNNPSNGNIIDCAGVWTYGLFDAFGNIICWGKVTAEDKRAPELVCAPADITLDCYDVSYVLNNPLTIGNRDTTNSPRPAATGNQTINNAEGVAKGAQKGDNCTNTLAPPNLLADNIKNLGYAYFRDNCRDCGCRINLKWTDKVVYYSCTDIEFTRDGYYAKIEREWVATDCNGMSSSDKQDIYFKRPSIKSFTFANTTRTGVTTKTGVAAGAPNYDWVVEYNSCTPDKSLIAKGDVTPRHCSWFNTASNPRCLYIDQVECNYSVTIKDTEFPICNGKGVKIDREMFVFDWCKGGIVDTIHILIKIGDFEAPKLEYAHHAPFDISTGPMDCTAAIPTTAAGIKAQFGVTIKDNCTLGNISVSVKTKDRYVKGILVAENVWEKVDYAVMNGMMIGLPVGTHRLIIDASDGCYNAKRDSFNFEVKDKIAPVMKCDDDLHVTLSNANGYTNGYAQVSAADIDEGSWDNCKLAWIAVRRNVPASCEASFVQKGYDSNGNNKLDAAPFDHPKDAPAGFDWSTVDGVDINGDGDISDFGEFVATKGGKKMTPLLDFVEFFCCDLTERVTVELWGADTADDPKTLADETNYNYCWMDLLIEDKVTPTCIAPWDVTIDCDDKNIALIDDKVASSKIWGDVTITTGNDCAALDTVYSVEKSLKCGYGKIVRKWTLSKQTAKGPITITCSQTIWIRPIHQYDICFPKDVSTDCKTPTADTVIVDELACDLLAVNVSDKRYDATEDECYKIFRTYTVINWCAYDDKCGDPMAEGNVFVVDRSLWGNNGKNPIYVLTRDRDRDLNEEFWLSKDLTVNNGDDIYVRGDGNYGGLTLGANVTVSDKRMPACEAYDLSTDHFQDWEYHHSFMYTQIIKVYDDVRPEVTGIRDTFCTSPTACTANITKVVTLKDNCSDKVSLETQYLMIAPFQTTAAGSMIPYSTLRWSTKDLGNGNFQISVSNLPEGTHDLIVVGRDECGNLSLATRIPFTIKDCKAPAPICINGLSVDLMPDGNGGGMMTVWASDFVASKIYDCNGQGPETKDGLKLVTKYSVNRVKEPVNPNQTSISVNCADLELGFILVELHAWDEAGNHDFCITFVEVQDNNKVCPAPADKIGIAGTIATEGAGNLQGVTVTLSGGGTQNDMTGVDGNYEFVNLARGGDFTVTPQLDKNHLNGVSTFDLVLIQKHILGVQALNSPYKMIAADANNSKTITTLDMIQIRKLILNIDTHFANNTSWRFVDAAYRFPNTTNPWVGTFPEVVSVNDLTGNIKANFVAIKVGDVNASASISGATAAEIRTNSNFELKTQEQNLKAGNEYKIAFTAADLKNIQGYQFALNLDQSKVELLDIEHGVAKAENFGVFKQEGIITTSWNAKYEPGTLFTLILRAKADSKLSQSLSLNRLVNPEAYDQNSEYLGIKLAFEGEQTSESYELKQNTPNPFGAETSIGFTLPKAAKATLSIRDVKGALVYKVEGNYAKGSNQIMLKKEQLGASGVLYYTLETSDFTATKKMIILQ